MKRQSLLLFGWLLLVTPVVVQAQFNYTITNGTITITGYTGTNKDVVIPSTIDGLQVINIGAYAFYATGITSASIPEGVTSIGDWAFCSSLASVTIANTVTNIGDEAFYGCRLTTVTIPNSVTIVGVAALEACWGLTNIVVSSLNPTYSSANGILFDKGQTTLIQYPIGQSGDSFTIPNSVTSIGDDAFWGARLSTVIIGTNVTSIGTNAFINCISLNSVTISNGVTSIRRGAFSGTALTSLAVPNSVTNIEAGVFGDCRNLTNIEVSPLNPAYCSLDGVLFDKQRKILVEYPERGPVTYIIPDGVTSIGPYAFYGAALTSVSIPNGVTFIATSAFSWSGLTSVAIPGTVTNIGDHAFSNCGSLTNVIIGSGVASIGDYAFAAWSSLTGVYFEGNAPECESTDFLLESSWTPKRWPPVYYLPGTTGWGTNFAGLPTALWLPQSQTADTSFGVKTNQFGFNITWVSDKTVVVETSTSLSGTGWTPLVTNTLTSGSIYFTDPDWMKHRNRFYRIRSQ